MAKNKLVDLLWKNKEQIKFCLEEKALFDDTMYAEFRGERLDIGLVFRSIFFRDRGVHIDVPVLHPLYWLIRKQFKQKERLDKQKDKDRELSLYSLLTSKE